MQKHRLGLALSGGGFRASLFHLGVLRRLAELGLLRHVTHMSTVSGGSIVAALYYLHFKRAFEQAKPQGVLSNLDYVQIVGRVEAEFVDGVKKDIRNRLLSNPLTHLRELTSGNGFGHRMAQLYTRYFYKTAISEIFPNAAAKDLENYTSQGVPLHQLITRLPGPDDAFVNRSTGYPNLTEPERSLVDFNESEQYANIPALVINATCLNTGGPFYFTLNEVGGPDCGFVRTDEVFMILQYKVLLESLGDEPVDSQFLDLMYDVALKWGKYLEETRPELPKTAFRRENREKGEPEQPAEECFPQHTREHLCFYQAARRQYRERGQAEQGKDLEGDTWVPKDYEFGTEDVDLGGLKNAQYWGTIRHLLEANFDILRKAKIAAWTLLDRIGWQSDAPEERRGGFTRQEYEAELMRTLLEIDARVAHDFTYKGGVPRGLMTLIVDLYYFRSAGILDWRAYETLHRITMSQAVAASANFPPMFIPLKINELFETSHMAEPANGQQINAVHLTDGGVHDNQGIEWLLDAGYTHIIVSDASGLLSMEQQPGEARLPMMDRIIDVLMGGVRRVQLRRVRETLNVSDLLASRPVVTSEKAEELAAMRRSAHLKMATVFHMTSHPRDAEVPDDEVHELLPPFAPQLVAQLRTDLDAFNELEIAALRHQGYQLADCYGRKMARLPQFKLDTLPPLPVSPVTLPVRLNDHGFRVLAAGARRTARYSVAFPFQAALLAAMIAILISFSARQVDDWSSWDSIRRFTDIDVSRQLPRGLQSFYITMTATSQWRTFSFGRDVLFEWVSHTSILTVLFIGWALVVVGRGLVRASETGRKRVKMDYKRLVRRDTARRNLALLKRPTNLISIVAMVLACSTLHVKWLLAVIHLWTLPVAGFFLFVHLVFTRLWLNTGKLERGSGGPGTVPAAAPVMDATEG
jgi:predicted acylesterase/phospholipase RssA